MMKDRQPCPQCGSVGRQIIVVQTETVGISDSVITQIEKTAQDLILTVMPLSRDRAMSGFLRPDGIFEPLGVGHPLMAMWRALQELRERPGSD